MNAKRKKVQEYILQTIAKMDPTGPNVERYKNMFAEMSDQEFDKYMKMLKEGTVKLTVYAPNMKNYLKVENLFKAAEFVNAKLFHRILRTDHTTGLQYWSNEKYLVVTLPIRRARQFLMHKISVAESDQKIDALTGQVTKPDKASAISFVEAQLLGAQGLEKTLEEFLKVRGGDVRAFGTYKQQLEETGASQMAGLDPTTVPRSAVVFSNILRCMYYDNNLVEGM
jgi:hypothetical protein